MPPKLNRNASVQGPMVISSGFHSLNENGMAIFLSFYLPLSNKLFLNDLFVCHFRDRSIASQTF